MASRPVDNKLNLEEFNKETVSEMISLILSHLNWYQGAERLYVSLKQLVGKDIRGDPSIQD